MWKASNRALQLSAEAVINVCFELLGVSENPKEVMALELPILRGQIGCCWISDEMVGRWVFFFGKEFTVIPKFKLVELWKMSFYFMEKHCRNKLERDLTQSFFFSNPVPLSRHHHHYIGMYYTPCSDLQVPPEELCHKLRFLYADVEYGAMTITKRPTRGNGFEYRRFAELTAQELGNPNRSFLRASLRGRSEIEWLYHLILFGPFDIK